MILLQMRALLFQFQRHCRSSVRYEYRGCHVLACKKTSNGKIPFYPSKTPTISLASSSRRPRWANAIDRPSLAKLLPPVDSPLCPLPTSMSLTAGHLSVCRESGTQMAVLFTAADHGHPSFIAAILATIMLVESRRIDHRRCWPHSTLELLPETFQLFFARLLSGPSLADQRPNLRRRHRHRRCHLDRLGPSLDLIGRLLPSELA